MHHARDDAGGPDDKSMEMPMRCPRCGQENRDDSLFCTACGADLSKAVPQDHDAVSSAAFIERQSKSARKRATIHTVSLTAAIVVATLIGVCALVMRFSDKLQGIVAVVTGQELVAVEAEPTDSGSTEETPASLLDFVGTWECDDYDYDGVVRRFVVSFSDYSICYATLFEGDTMVYAGSRKYSGSDGVVTDATGLAFTISPDRQTLTLMVSEDNQQHQVKDEYTFVKTEEYATGSTMLQNSYEWWYPEDPGQQHPQMYLSDDGFCYFGQETTSTCAWWIERGAIVVQTDDGYLFLYYDESRTDRIVESTTGEAWTRTEP